MTTHHRRTPQEQALVPLEALLRRQEAIADKRKDAYDHDQADLAQAKELLEIGEGVIAKHEHTIIALQSRNAALLATAKAAVEDLAAFASVSNYDVKLRRLEVVRNLRAAIAQAEERTT